MKSTLLVFTFLLGLPLMMIGQDIERNDNGIYEWQAVVEVEAESATILAKIDQWLILKGVEGVNATSSEKSETLVYRDGISIEGMMTGDVDFVTRIDVKDGKFRMTCNQFIYSAMDAETGGTVSVKLERAYMTKKTVIKRSEKKLNAYLVDLTNFINGKDDDDW